MALSWLCFTVSMAVGLVHIYLELGSFTFLISILSSKILRYIDQMIAVCSWLILELYIFKIIQKIKILQGLL